MTCARWFALLAALVCFAGCFTPTERPTELQSIARWQDQRLAPVDSLRAMIASPDAHVRLAAVRAAGLIGRDDVLPQVIDALDDASLTVQAEAAWSLGLMGSALALPSLDQATTNPRPAVREAALAALAHLENDGTALLVAAQHDDPASAALAWNGLRNQAARVDSTAMRAAIVLGLQRPEADVRWRVLRCIEQVGDSTLVNLVAPFVQSEIAAEVVHAHRALSRLSGPQVLPAILVGWDHLATFKARDLSRVQIAACRSLGAAANARLQPEELGQIAALLTNAAGQGDPHVSEMALVAMARLVVDQALPPEAANQESLLPVWRIRLARSASEHLKSPHVGVRSAAIAALGALRGAGARQQMEWVLEHETSSYVLASGLTTYASHHPDPLAALSKFAQTPSEKQPPHNAIVRSTALAGLNDVRLQRPEVIQAP